MDERATSRDDAASGATSEAPGSAMATAPDADPAANAAFLTQLLDALPDLVFAKDTDGRYLHVNRAFAEAMGRGPDAIVGRHDAELRTESEAVRERAADQACLETRTAIVQPEATRGPMRGADGRPIGVAGVVRATPGRPVAGPRPTTAATRIQPSWAGSPRAAMQGRDDEDAATTAMGGLEAVLHGVPVAIYTKSVDGTYSGANAAFARMIGAAGASEVTGHRDTDFPWRALDHPKLDEEVLKDGRARHGVQRREVDRFARRRWTETSVVPQVDKLGRVTGVVGIRLDVTAHRNEVAQVERARAAAEQASRSKSAFLTQMSHELRTPLTSLLGFAELALEDDTDAASRVTHLERIRDNGWQVLALVDDLLDLSRIESGRLATRARVFDPREVIDGLGRTYGPRLRAAGLVLEVEIDDAVPEAVTSDPIRFRQILANLLERARAEATGGTVSIRATVSGRDRDATLVVEVRDEGPSLGAEELARRLNPFEQEGEVGGDRGGLGLGLAIAWSLADLLEGRIDHDPGAGGHGTRFTLRLPVRASTGADAGDWSPATREAHDPWQRVEAAARDGVAWFAPPPEDLDAEDEAGRPLASEVDGRPAEGDPPFRIQPPATARQEPARPTVEDAGALLPDPGSNSGSGSNAGSAIATSAPDQRAEDTARPADDGQAVDPASPQRILLAEDTADTARFLMLVLRSRGHDVEHAVDGAAALAMHREATERGRPFDLVLTDVQMPRMDGLSLARALRTDGWPGPIIALTAHASVEHRREAMEAGCDDHVAKPLTPDRLQELVRRHADRASRRAA